jgi:hypothetical protein
MGVISKWSFLQEKIRNREKKQGKKDKPEI